MFQLIAVPPQPLDFTVELRNTATTASLTYRWTVYTNIITQHFVIKLCNSSKDCDYKNNVTFIDFGSPVQRLKHDQRRSSPLKPGRYHAVIYSGAYSLLSNKSYYLFNVGKYFLDVSIATWPKTWRGGWAYLP